MNYARTIAVVLVSVFTIASVGYAATHNITDQFGAKDDTFVISGKVINRSLKVNKSTRLNGKLRVQKNARFKRNVIVDGNVNIKNGVLKGVGASEIAYTNTSSGLTAETTQDAIDELNLPTLEEAVNGEAQWTPVVYDIYDESTSSFPQISEVDGVTLRVSFNEDTDQVVSDAVNSFKPLSKAMYDAIDLGDETPSYVYSYQIVGNSLMIFDGSSSYTLDADILSPTQIVLTPSDTTDNRNLRRIMLTALE